MLLYRLRHPPEDAGEGENWDEWFSSLRDAKRRRAEVIAEARASLDADTRYLPYLDLAIERVILADLPKKQLVLRCLNGSRYVRSAEVVVPEYE